MLVETINDPYDKAISSDNLLLHLSIIICITIKTEVSENLSQVCKFERRVDLEEEKKKKDLTFKNRVQSWIFGSGGFQNFSVSCVQKIFKGQEYFFFFVK